MNETTEMFSVGSPLPTIAAVEQANGPFSLSVHWAGGARKGKIDVIDVAPQIFTFKVYTALRNDSDLFASVKVSNDKTAVVWPGNEDLEISADVLEELAEQSMSNVAFAQFMKSQNWTLDATAAQLGISRRLVAYYAKERDVPRLIFLACLGLERLTAKPSLGSAQEATASISGKVGTLRVATSDGKLRA